MVFPALCRLAARRRRDRPVRPQLVQPRRGRTGLRLFDRHAARGVLSPVAGVRTDAGRRRDHPGQAVAERGPRRTAAAFLGPRKGPAEAVEAKRHRRGRAGPVGRLYRGDPRHAGGVPFADRALDRDPVGRQAPRPDRRDPDHSGRGRFRRQGSGRHRNARPPDRRRAGTAARLILARARPRARTRPEHPGRGSWICRTAAPS